MQFSFFIGPLTKFLFLQQYNSIFWKIFKKTIIWKFGLYTNNLTKSYSYAYQCNLLWGVDNCFSVPNKKVINISNIIRESGKPIKILHFAFQKKLFNTFMFYIIFLLVDGYTTIHTHFKLQYGFILFKNNFITYPFLNEYYFKVRNI